ncbi:MAG: hypothetical protein IKM66_07590 [Clostridia bacterium]|nr:hypothetical protein [Clostridia bacterium]
MKFKIKNIGFSVGIPFLAAAAFFLSGDMRANYFCAVLFSALHEAGHILALVHFGKKPKKITLGVMGIRIEKSDIALSYREECITALCGPFVNLIFSVIFALIDITGLPFAINTGLFIINMLPVKTLDGGRFIYNFISAADEEKASKVINTLEIGTALMIIAVLIVSLITGYVNTSFVLFSVFLVIIIVSEFMLRG